MELNKYIDHTNLKNKATLKDIEKLDKLYQEQVQLLDFAFLEVTLLFMHN